MPKPRPKSKRRFDYEIFDLESDEQQPSETVMRNQFGAIPVEKLGENSSRMDLEKENQILRKLLANREMPLLDQAANSTNNTSRLESDPMRTSSPADLETGNLKDYKIR